MSPRLYLDHNATSPLRPEARVAVLQALDQPGNPSSVHASGRAARARIEAARDAVAALVAGSSERLVFTSGGTEADALALTSLVEAEGVRRLILGATEHEAVSATAEASGLPVEVWPVDGDGVADLDWLADRLARWSAGDGRPVVALMLANNETGVVQPVAAAARLLHDVGGRLHVDAVQAAGKIEVDLAALGADTLAVSAHKFGGPQGVGALAYAAGVDVRARQRGGGQERGLRAGTEATASIAGFGAAASAALRDLPAAARQAGARDAAARRLADAGARIAGAGAAARLPGALCLAAADFPSALQVMALDLDGVEVSAGAACSSGKVRPSGVLTAMGYGDLAAGALRASGGWSTMDEDWVRFADAWLAAHARRAASRPAARVREYA